MEISKKKIVSMVGVISTIVFVLCELLVSGMNG